MTKTKLTLYVNKDISEKAKKISNISGRSISAMVSDYFNYKEEEFLKHKISESINKWIGIAKTDKTYKELRDELISDKISNIWKLLLTPIYY